MRIVYPSAPGSFVKLVRELSPSVVHLRSSHKVHGGPAALLPGAGDSNALGSAFVLDRDGHLVTSAHLIGTAPEIRAVLASGDEYVAQVVGQDAKLDLALLKINAPAAVLTPIRTGDSDPVEVGEWVLALGNPEGSEVTASAGIISSLGASNRDEIAGTQTNYQSFMRTDAKIDVGNSGGPLVNTAGAVIGVSSAVSTKSGDMRLVVPISRARQIFPMLKTDGVVTRAWLGVFVHPVGNEVAKAKRLERASGALVSDVVPASPAARAGIVAGDVIIEFDGKAVDHRTLPFLASTAGVGRQIPVLVWRSGQPRELIVVSAKMPE
ncbi:MAG: PDZ domain-containing protein [Myxococcales bacterium]|nr:PDZ domain-containing protein [Myxococcales bacterium]